MGVKKQSLALLEGLRAAHSTRKPEPVAPMREASGPAFDFTTLEAYQQVKIARSAGKTFGIPSPFFRQIDAVRGTSVQIAGQWLENFASYDYLGLNQHDALLSGVTTGTADWGVSASASRLVGGERRFHRDLETAIARFVGTPSALALVSGHATNVALIRTIVQKGDLVVVDALAHNSIYEGIRASGADHISFPHSDWAWVNDKLEDIRDSYKRVLIAVEGLYSMDGDMPDLARFIAVKSRHRAWLMVDEAHSLGVLGKTGRGICEEQGVDPAQVEMFMGTLSKSLCSCGGYIAGSEGLIDLIRYTAPGFVFSVGLSAPNAHAALAALRAIEAEPERVTRLRALSAHFLKVATEAGLETGPNMGFAVAPVMIGDSIKATWIANQLLEAGFNVLPIIAPAVPDKGARLRFFLTAGHDEAVIDRVIAETARLVALSRDLSLADMASAP